VWLASFSAVYGLNGLICGHGLNGSPGGLDIARVLLVMAYGLAVATQTSIVWALHRSRMAASGGFAAFVSRTTAWVGLAATIWTLLPTITTSRCH
jgi:hypothetical protein